MTFFRASFVATIATAFSLTAQSEFTSPAGLLTTEGQELFLMFGERRLQGLDNTLPGPVANIDSIAFRRDGFSTSSAGRPRTMVVDLLMGHGDFQARSSNFANNFTAGSTVAVASRTVNFPDWVMPPATAPAPFDFVIPFDQPWSYLGGLALIWDISCTQVSDTSNTPMDRGGVSSTLGTSGDVLGTGCVSTGRTSPYSHTLTLLNSGPLGDMRLRYSGSNAPSNAPTVLHLDLFDAMVSIPELCSTLHSLGGIASLPVANASSTGTVASITQTFPYSAGVVGLPFVGQLLSLDAGQPGLAVSLSNGRAVTMPEYMEVAYVWSSLPGSGAGTGTLITPGTIPVARFTH